MDQPTAVRQPCLPATGTGARYHRHRHRRPWNACADGPGMAREPPVTMETGSIPHSNWMFMDFYGILEVV